MDAITAEADASGEQQLTVGEQQLKRIDCNRGAAAEADAIREQLPAEADTIRKLQLFKESCPALDYSCRRTRGK